MDFESYINRLYAGLESGKTKFKSDSVLNTDFGINYYRDLLLNKVCRIFEYKNLPFEQKNIELPTIINGYSGFTFDKSYNDYICVAGALSGVTPFPDTFPNFTYGAPKCAGGTKPIYPINKHGSVVIVNNDTCRNSMYPLIYRYACLLAHSDTTIKTSLINARYNSYMVAEDDATRESMISWRKKVERGEVVPIIDKSLTESAPIIPINNVNAGNLILQSIEGKDEIMRQFYNDIGIRKNKDKRGNMVADEVTQNDMALFFNISDMLKQRQYAVENINALYGLNVSVDLSEEYKEMIFDKWDGDN